MSTITRDVVATTGDLGGKTLLQDRYDLKVISPPQNVVVESAGVKRQVLRLGGQFQLADHPNANGRIYERTVLASAVQDLQEAIQSRRVVGELDHPADAKIHMDRVSHLVTKLWMEDDGAVYGELEIIRGTPMGNTLAALVEGGVTIGISSRGVGDLEDIVVEGRTYQRVMEGYTLVTFDIVGEPSVGGSFLDVMEERQRALQAEQKNKSEKMLAEEIKSLLKGRLL